MMQMLKQISKYSFLFDAGGVLYVLIELAWRGRNHCAGIFNRIYRQYLAWLECLGLQWHTRQRPGPDLSAVHSAVDAGESGRYHSG